MRLSAFVPRAVRAVALGCVLAAGGLATASPIAITGALTGDPRTSNPDNLFINVTITGDTTSNFVDWVIDIASPLHPNAKLDEFYFSMVGAAADYSFSGYSPAGWLISSPASTVGGGNFNPTFLFEANDTDNSNANNVTNSVNLLFRMTKSTGNFVESDFLTAASLCSTDITLGCGQLGAHLQSLTVAPGSGLSDSGFLLGNYSGGGGGVVVVVEVPEPGSLALAGLALLAGGVASRRKAGRRGSRERKDSLR